MYKFFLKPIKSAEISQTWRAVQGQEVEIVGIWGDHARVILKNKRLLRNFNGSFMAYVHDIDCCEVPRVELPMFGARAQLKL